ncbi:clan AA aspartic protease [Thalassomonas viridans]|uniref:Clan AA aspartic protease n=1 Tax=Thalassomonas viridans TaxID=137584 RepID=A0AAE9Z1Y6_9GAMM|nr:retropepsin-like aspartic protease [Thalassomonas viridans]WDE05306.1 clan AA aspartic protease [Thalassomonas viridans]
MAITAEDKLEIPDLSWIKADGADRQPFEHKLRQVYRLMLDADFEQAQAELEKMYRNSQTEQEKSFLLSRWLLLLTELQAFDKIGQLVKQGIVAPDDVNAVLAGLYQGQGKPVTEFLQDSATMPLESHFLVSLPRVKIRLAGKSYYFVLDTGASVNVLSHKLAKKLKLDLPGGQKVNIDTANSEAAAAFAVIMPEFQLGPASFYRQPAVVVDGDDLQQTFLGFNWYRLDGIIGWPVLKQLALTLDFNRDRLTLARPVPSAAKEKNLVWLFDDPLVITSDSRDKQLMLFLDTGAMNSQVTPQYLAKNNLTVADWKEKRFNGIGGKGQTEKFAVIPDVYFSFPSQKTHLKKIDLRMDHIDCKHTQCDGRIGVDTSENRVMYIDFANAIFDVKP